MVCRSLIASRSHDPCPTLGALAAFVFFLMGHTAVARSLIKVQIEEWTAPTLSLVSLVVGYGEDRLLAKMMNDFLGRLYKLADIKTKSPAGDD